jgi:lectin, mannose-binding 2
MKSFLSSALALLASSMLPGSVRAQDDNVRSISLRTHTLNPPYLDSDMQSRWFDFGGDTVVRTDQYIRLTPEKHSRSGWLFSRVPLTATNWEVRSCWVFRWLLFPWLGYSLGGN